MAAHVRTLAALGLFLASVWFLSVTDGQELARPLTFCPEAAPLVVDGPAPEKGVEVLARGPVHEAFASPSVEPRATPLVTKKPPAPLEEMAPEDRPEGDVVWIGGYWAWDDEREDFLWVSGCWRTQPPGKEWIAGYWRGAGERHQWVPGFWTASAAAGAARNEVTYFPEPPPPPAVAPPGEPPSADSFHVPGYWVWSGDRYAWRAGYWGRIRPDHVWIAAHYRWTPHGYIYVPGYWDLVVTRRGILYAPVQVDFVFLGPRFVFTPRFAVCDTIIFDALFVRPAHCHYYFGDYYGPTYHRLGFESCVVYSRRHYDAVIAYRRYEYRHQPRWLDVQINLVAARDAGHAPRPPRTLAQQNTFINSKVINITKVTNVYNTTVIAPTKMVAAARGAKTVALGNAARSEARDIARKVQDTAIAERKLAETKTDKGAFSKPRVASFTSTTAAPFTSSGGKTFDGKGSAGGKTPTGDAGKDTSGIGKTPTGEPGKGDSGKSGPGKAGPGKGKTGKTPGATLPPGVSGTTAPFPIMGGMPPAKGPTIIPKKEGKKK